MTVSWRARQGAVANLRQLGVCFGLTPVDDRRLAGSRPGDLLALLERQLDGTD